MIDDFHPNNIVRHVFHGRYFTVVKVGRKYVHCFLNMGDPDKLYRFLPSSLVKVEDNR